MPFNLSELLTAETLKLLIAVMSAIAAAAATATAAYTMNKFVRAHNEQEKIIIEFKNGQRLEIMKRGDQLERALAAKIRELEAEVERLKKAAENKGN